MGFFGSSCSAAITKNFGALTMSITSTARKATTLFLSFMLFDNECTLEHIGGIVVFISALTAKSLRRKGKRRNSDSRSGRRQPAGGDVESGSVIVSSASSFDSADLASPSKSKRRTGHRSSSPTQGADTHTSSTVRHYVV